MAYNEDISPKIAKEIQELLDKEVVKPAVDALLQDVVDTSPVTTGRLQKAWRRIEEGEGEYELRNTTDYISYVITGAQGRMPNSFIDSAILRRLRFFRRVN